MQSKMKVLLIDVNCKYSSTGKIVYSLYNSIIKHGDDAAVCYGRGQKVEGRNIYKFGLDWETYLHAILSRITGINGCFSFFSTLRLIRFIKNYQPDVIHIHELHAYFVNQKRLISYIKKCNIPVVWTFHCEYMYTGKCGYAYDCEKWKSECNRCPAVKEYPKSIFFDHTKYMYNKKKEMLGKFHFKIVAPSEWLANRIRQSFLSNNSIDVIHNGIDCENTFYYRDKEETNYLLKKYNLGNKKIILSVAPYIMDERKGGETILKIAAKMTDLQFVLIGCKKDEIYSHNVLMLSAIKDQNELAKWYSLADEFLICSKRENFPTTCLEAMCCGLPVVGLDNGGTKETVPPPYGKFITINEYSLIDDNFKIIEDAISSQLVWENNKEKISKKGFSLYSNKQMYSEYIKLYRQAITVQH